MPTPSGSFSFLGAAGAPVWSLPQVQNPSLLWPGNLHGADRYRGWLQGNSVTWRIDSGEARIPRLHDQRVRAAAVVFTTNSAFPLSIQLTVPSHAHYNWAFAATGTYTVVMRATATLAGGTPVTSGPVTYTVRVGPL